MPTPPHTLEFVPDAFGELEIWMTVDCPNGGVQRDRVAHLIQPASENPGLKLEGILGLNAVDEICQAVKANQHKRAVNAAVGDVLYAGWRIISYPNDKRGAVACDEKNNEHRLCRMCGHPEDVHPWTGPPKYQRGKCPSGTPIYPEALGG